MDKISVIVPVYKVEPYLDRCIQSIVAQTYTNLEIILVDDGSPDNCGAICDTWAIRDSRFKVIHKENGGLSDARNAGLAAASGEYIAFVDSDDWLSPSFIAELYTTLIENNADVAECGVSYVDESGNTLHIRHTTTVPVLDKLDALKLLILEDGIYQTVWNKLYRRSILNGIQFEKGKYHEDDYWTYQVFDRISKLAVRQIPLYFYLQRNSSIMGANYSLKRLDGLEARFLQMKYLQKYEELAFILQVRLLSNCLYHHQCVLQFLSIEEQAQALAVIQRISAEIPSILAMGHLPLKQQIWLRLFLIAPNWTAKVRNKLNIGL